MSRAFRLSRTGADILLAGQLQVPIQQIYTETTFFQHVIFQMSSHPLLPQTIAAHTHKSEEEPFHGTNMDTQSQQQMLLCIMLITVATVKFTLGNSITNLPVDLL